MSAAHCYAEHGWPVLPCEPKGKRPLGQLVQHGLLEASTDHATIEWWWRTEPRANVAVATGGWGDVLDVDGNDGLTALNVAIPADARPLDGPTVATGGGGLHCYFQPTGLGNRARFLPGCDWRGKGGYVVTPPSVHPKDRPYSWVVGADDPDFGRDAPLLPVPEWLLARLQKPVITEVAASARGTHCSSDAYGRRALECEVGKVLLAATGARNDTLNRAAFSLGQLVGGGVLDVDEVVDALLLAAARVGLEETEARRTIASGLGSGAAQPRRLSA